MAKSKTIGVIGLGSIGRRHADNLSPMKVNVRVYDPALNAGTAFADNLEGAASIDELVDKSDAIVIASPTPLHHAHISACKGKPLFVEKPIADALPVTLTDIKMVGYNLRFHSCVKKAKEWLDAGHLGGQPIWANFTLGQYNEKPSYLRDGVILNWSHEIDLALYLCGIGGVSCSSTRVIDEHDDLTDITLIQSGCRTTIHLDYLTRPEVRQFLIVGQAASIIVDLVHRVAWLRRVDDVIVDQFVGQDTWNSNYVDEMKEFLALLDNPDLPRIGATAQEGFEALKICLKVREQAGL